MMEAATEPTVSEALEKPMLREISDDDIFKPKNQPTTEVTAAETESEKADLCKAEDEANSDASSPEPPALPQPGFTVRFTDRVTKNGDRVSYGIQVTATSAPHSSLLIERQYEDLEYLEQVLSGGREPGVIAPPLPPRPASDPAQAEQRSRRQLGSDSAVLLGDDWQRDCRVMERYLSLLLRHPVLGQHPALEAFLTRPDPPVRTLVRRSLLTRLTEGLSSRATHPDCDEYFQRVRVQLNEQAPLLQQAAEAFSATVFAQQRLSNQLSHLATACNIGVGTNEGWGGLYHRLNVRFSSALSEYKRGVDLAAASCDGTLGQTLELYARYAQAESEMLLRRTGLMMEYEAANRALEKTRPQRRQAAEDAKRAAEEAFEECSDVAKSEVRSLHRVRSVDLMTALRQLAQSQVHAGHILQAELSRHLESLRQFHVPEPGQLGCRT